MGGGGLGRYRHNRGGLTGALGNYRMNSRVRLGAVEACRDRASEGARARASISDAQARRR
jgi:hypothetical protein